MVSFSANTLPREESIESEEVILGMGACIPLEYQDDLPEEDY